MEDFQESLPTRFLVNISGCPTQWKVKVTGKPSWIFLVQRIGVDAASHEKMISKQILYSSLHICSMIIWSALICLVRIPVVPHEAVPEVSKR